MKITACTIRYEELRNNEYSRSNKKVSVGLSAQIEETDDPVKVRELLLKSAKAQVKAEFGDVGLDDRPSDETDEPNIELD